MENEIIPKDQALDLKELEFEYVSTIFAYDEAGELYTRSGIPHDFNIRGLLSAPTFSQCFRWFREKYDLHPSFTRYKSSSINREPNIFTNLYEIQIIDENVDKIFNVGDFNFHEEAELACLKKLIEIVKEKL